MPNGFTFNSQPCSDFGLIMKSKNRQMFAGADDNYIKIPGRDGSYLFPGGLEDIEMTVTCGFAAANLENLRVIERNIMAWLYTTDKKILSFDDQPGKYYLAKLAGQVNPDQLYRYESFDLKFRCDPYLYGAEVSQAFADDATTAINAGSAATPPRFMVTFTDAASEWKVALGTGEYIRIVHDFISTDTLEINCATGAILHNGSRGMNLLDWQNSKLFNLSVGNNGLAITPAGKCNTTVYWIPRYL